MGRYSQARKLVGKVHLRRVYLNSGGYDDGGAYWGWAEPLYCAYTDEAECYVRAKHREIAKWEILQQNPDLTFYSVPCKRMYLDQFVRVVNLIGHHHCTELNKDSDALFGAVHVTLPESMLKHYYDKKMSPAEAYITIQTNE